MKNFTIIKNSESKTGYQIEDKEFKGLIPGLCCGWQYEYSNDKGEITYSSVSWEEESPEDYAYRWLDNGRSWLESSLGCGFGETDWRFTGRVIFRGYAESFYDPEERDWYVKEVDV